MFDPHAFADAQGVTVEHRPGLPEQGRYYPSRRHIVLRAGLTPLLERVILTHELGHHNHGHYCSSPRAELLADRWAAARLIDPAELEQIARAHPDNPGAWCLHLGITPRLLEVHLGQQHGDHHPLRHRLRA